MRAIQKYLPEPRLTEIHRVIVKAPPELAWEAARHFDGSTISWVRFLFDLRTLPSRISGGPPEVDRRIGVDQITAETTGFSKLEERAGEEVVVGAIGQFWHLDIPFQKVPVADFAAFKEPGWGKLAWSIHVEPFGAGSVLTLELRTTANDEASWAEQVRYFHLIGPMSRLIRRSMMSHLEAQLGPMSRPNDKHRVLPGDELLTPARYLLTHSIDIEAPPALVWRWLMQLGCDRGGWYSVDVLDNGGRPSVEHLVYGWRERKPKEIVKATPTHDGGFVVLAAEPDRLFVLGAEGDRLGGHIESTWSFVLEPLGQDATHLITRVRARGAPRWSEWLQGAVIFPPVHAFMQHAQLDNLKRLAERSAGERSDQPATSIVSDVPARSFPGVLER